MKGMKGKLMKKLKTVKQIGYLNPDRILQVSNFDGFVDNLHLKSTFVDNFPFKSHNKSHSSPQSKSKPKPKFEKNEVISVEELMKELAEDENEEEFDKENIRPSISKGLVCEMEKSSSCCKELKKDDPVSEMVISTSCCKDSKKDDSSSEMVISSSCCKELVQENPVCEIERLSCCGKELKKEEALICEKENSSSCCKEMNLESDFEVDVSCFRRPDMNSVSLFDPKLLAAFEEAVKEHIRRNKEEAQMETSRKNHKYPFFQPENETDPLVELEDQSNPLEEFEEKCPPGGSDSVIFYTTSLRGIRKTFEDCQSIRFLLESFGLIFYERDVSIHSEFRDELWRIMGEKCLPPRLFIRGRYIGGAEQVLTLNEQGKLRALFRDIPIDFSEGPCNVCSGLRFILCYYCSGSRKVFENEGISHGGIWTQCLQCNENGLVVCPLC